MNGSGIINAAHVNAKIVETAVDGALNGFFYPQRMDGLLGNRPRPACHIVVMIASTEAPATRQQGPIGEVMFSKTTGDRRSEVLRGHAEDEAYKLWWQHPEGGTAGSGIWERAQQLQWGGVKRHGIVVVCGGCPPHIGIMLGEIIAAAIKGLSHENGDVQHSEYTPLREDSLQDLY